MSGSQDFGQHHLGTEQIDPATDFDRMAKADTAIYAQKVK